MGKYDKRYKNLVFVDVEGGGPCPALAKLEYFEFGAVIVSEEVFVDMERFPLPSGSFEWFHVTFKNHPFGVYTNKSYRPAMEERIVYEFFAGWLAEHIDGQPVFVSDNVAYDWQFINDGFWRTINRNPFGHSARRISDYYAGLRGNFRKTQDWKRLRITKHDHNPVNDAKGNAEAFIRIERGER